MSPTSPMTTQELQQLETWLAAPAFKGKALQLPGLQGFLAAVSSSPDTIPPSVWLPHVLGGVPDPSTLEQSQQLLELLMRFYNSVAGTLFDNQPLQLILSPTLADPDTKDYHAWCEGYIAGWSLSKEEWLRPGNEPLKRLTFPILLLSGAFQEAAERKGKKYIPTDEDLKQQQQCMQELPEAVAGIYNFWLAKRSDTAAPLRRDTPKIGRNEPCPCGSGKKFKQCCGSNRTLH